MQYITHDNYSIVYIGDRADYRDIVATTPRPGIGYLPVIVDGEHNGEWIAGPEVAQIEIERLKSELVKIDQASVRPLRAVSAGTSTQADLDYLASLEVQALDLRQQIQQLESAEV